MRSRPEGSVMPTINQRGYNLESTNNIVNSSGRRVRGFVGIEALAAPTSPPMAGGHDPLLIPPIWCVFGLSLRTCVQRKPPVAYARTQQKAQVLLYRVCWQSVKLTFCQYQRVKTTL